MDLIKRLAVVIVALGSVSVAQADQITINFDGIDASSSGDEPGTPLTNHFESDGIVFDGAWVHGGLSATRGSPPNYVSGKEITNNLTNPGPISGFFVNPSDASQAATVDYVELLSAFVDSDTTVFLSIFDFDGLLLDSVSRTGSSGILAINNPKIYSFTYSHINDGWNRIDSILGFDNLRFNTVVDPTEPPAPIPEPGTLGLLGVGLLWLGCLRRKYRAAINIRFA